MLGGTHLRASLPLAILVLALLLAPSSGAYGSLDVAPTLVPVLRPEVDQLLTFFIYGFYSVPATSGQHYKVGWDTDGRGAFVYNDADDDYRYDEGETRTPGMTLQLHGNATDHVLIMIPGEMRAQVCPTRAPEGLDGLARGLRCGGDLDRDGDGDVEELLTLRNPFMAGPDDDLRLLFPIVP